MVNQVSSFDEVLDTRFAAIATGVRRGLLAQLREGPRTAGDLWVGTGVTKPAISKHLGVLERSGLITREREGRTHWIALRAEALRPAADWIDDYRAFWDPRLDALVDQVEAEHRRAQDGGKP